MNTERSRQLIAALALGRSDNPLVSRCVRLGLVSTLGAALTICQPDVPVAQQRGREPEVKVKQIAASGGVVSITADGSLNRAQTWKDDEGFHVVLVNGATDLAAGSPRGVKVRRVGNSLEMVVPVKPGASVTVQPKGNRLDLVVNGDGFEPAARAEEQPTADAPRREQRQPREQRAPQAEAYAAAPVQPKRRPNIEGPTNETPQPSRREPASADSLPVAGAAPQSVQQTGTQPVAAGAGGDVPPSTEQPPTSVVQETAGAPDTAAQLSADEGTQTGSFLFSLPSLFALLGTLLLGALLFILRRRRTATAGADESEHSTRNAKRSVAGGKAEESQLVFEQAKGDRRQSNISVPFERRRQGHGAEDEATRHQPLSGGSNQGEGGETRTAHMALPAVAFGSYRIEQEVVHLVGGEPHSIEVLSSRAAEDRRAIEVSLLKALRAPETDEDGRRRARTALEDYGFVARESASLLLSPEPFERATAARTLGEMRSAQALPFLTEALYDGEAVVRTEVVQSLGALGLPSAIGALLDIARRHPELPATVLGPALTACSVESLELQWDPATEGRAHAGEASEEYFTGEISMLEPVGEVEPLPEWIEDEALLSALDRLESAEAETRVLSAQALAQFQVRRSVEALTQMAVRDTEPAVRAAAVTSLGVINHESVFVPVLVAMADDSREVRAAAARALSRLSFDRADAYVRVIENSDAATLGEVASACARSGLVGQAINRLASQDRRQAYEAFSLLSIAVRAGETAPILDAVECHRDIEVRLAAIRLLGLMPRPELTEQLRHIGENGGVPEKVRLAIREMVAGAGQSQPVASE